MTELSADLDDPIGQLQGNMAPIEAGQFQMGSDEASDEQPIHPVTLQGFEIARMPVTQAQYQAIMENNPSHFRGADLPVESVSWRDAIGFCRELSKRTGQQYTLPSEAQWEYACRAGSTGKYCFGDDESQLGDYAWYEANSTGSTHPVGRKKPNNWGLYDMHGNVWEWCLDHYHEDYKKAPRDGSAWQETEKGVFRLIKGSSRVFRGGSWRFPSLGCRCSYRRWRAPGHRFFSLGFRVVLVPISVAKGSERSELLK